MSCTLMNQNAQHGCHSCTPPAEWAALVTEPPQQPLAVLPAGLIFAPEIAATPTPTLVLKVSPLLMERNSQPPPWC